MVNGVRVQCVPEPNTNTILNVLTVYIYLEFESPWVASTELFYYLFGI